MTAANERGPTTDVVTGIDTAQWVGADTRLGGLFMEGQETPVRACGSWRRGS
jgi:hypothetical protein